MRYEIKNFEVETGNKFVGFKVEDEQGRLFYIDKRVPLEDGKTDEQYVSEAFALCQQEIQEWQDSFRLVGKTWNPITGSFE
jgi:hypothetical protein